MITTVMSFAMLAGIAFVTARFAYELFRVLYYFLLEFASRISFGKIHMPTKATTAKYILGASAGTWVLFIMFLPVLVTVAML